MPYTFSGEVAKMLRPFNKGKKRIGMLKVAPRVAGKIMETPAGTRFMIVEIKGRDIWRNRARSLAEAIDAGHAGIGLDKTLASRCGDYGVTTIMFVVEELRRIYLAPLADFFDEELVRMRPNWQGRGHRILPYAHFRQTYLGPRLQSRKRTAKKTA